jgi:hypothetical protein
MSKRSTSGGQRKEGAVAKKIKWLELAVIRSSPSSDLDAGCTSDTSAASLR